MQYAADGTVVLKESDDVITDGARHLDARIRSLRTDMRREHHIIHSQQLGRRTVVELEDIQPGSVDFFILQCFKEHLIL